jgi:ATP phosphoribosyltransferase regulatory subunit
VQTLPGHEHELEEFRCDRALVLAPGGWQIEPLLPGRG